MFPLLLLAFSLGLETHGLDDAIAAWDGRHIPLASYTEIEDACSQMLAENTLGSQEDSKQTWIWTLRRGQARFCLQKDELALKDFEKCYRVRPDSSEAAFEFARCAVRFPDSRTDGLQIAAELVKLQETAALGYLIIGSAKAHEKDWNAALDAYDKAIALASHWNAPREGRCFCNYLLKRYGRCLEDLTHIAEHPQATGTASEQFAIVRAFALLSMGKYEDGEAVMTDVFLRFKKNGDVGRAAPLQEALFNSCAIRREYRKCVALGKWRTRVLQNDALGNCQAARACAAIGRNDEALEFANRALECAVDSRESWSALARVYYSRGAFENAVRCFGRSRERETSSVPASPEDSLRLAFVLATCPDDRVRDGDRALAILEQAAEAKAESERNPQVLSLRAICYAELGRSTDAVRLMNRAIEIRPGPLENRRGWEELRDQFRRGAAYRHDPKVPEDHLYEFCPLRPFGYVGIRFPLRFDGLGRE